MCGCLVLLIGATFPRLAIVLLELFSGFNDRAFTSFWTGFAGFILLPYTTLFYVLMENWQDPIDGFGWFVVALGFVFDLSHYAGSARNRGELVVGRRIR